MDEINWFLFSGLDKRNNGELFANKTSKACVPSGGILIGVNTLGSIIEDETLVRLEVSKILIHSWVWSS